MDDSTVPAPPPAAEETPNINEPPRLKLTKFQLITILLVGLCDFFNAICYSILAPFFPYEAEKKGCSATEYGLIFGIFELVVFIISPVYGMYINRVGPRLLFKLGISLTAIMAILFGVLDKVPSYTAFVVLAFLIRIFEAVGNAAFLTASFAIIAHEFPDNVAFMFASLETTFGLGLIVGPTLGGVLYSMGGYSLPFVALGVALLLASILSFIWMPSSGDAEGIKSSGRANMLTLLKIPGVQLAALSIIASSMSIGFLQATLEPHLRQFHFSPIVLGLMFVINGGTYASTAPIWGWLCDRPGVTAKYVTVAGCAFVGAGFLLIGPAPFFNTPTLLWTTILGLVLHGIGIGAQLVSSFADALRTAMSKGMPNTIETYGLVSGMWTSTFALGAFIGPTISGLLYDAYGFRHSTLSIFLIQVILVLVIPIFIWVSKSGGMDVSVSAGDLLQLDGTLDGSVLIGDEFQTLVTRTKSRRQRISVEQSRPPAMNSLIACSSYKNRRSPWSQRTPGYKPSYGSLDSRFRGAVSNT